MRPICTFLALMLGFQPALAPAESETLLAATDRFEFRSDPRIGLHHFLLAWAAADADAWPPYALPIAERGYWRALLDEEERRAWSAATEAYAAAHERSLLFDEGLLALRDWAVGGKREAIPGTDRPLADAIEAALPVYRRHWWPAHDARNRAWIESVAPTLRLIEKDVVPRLEAAYGGQWPDTPVPMDVMVYCNPVGAYSTAGRVAISSADRGNGMPQGIELVFHEASHLDSLERPLRNNLANAFRAAEGEEPERLWHDLIFFTSGAIVNRVLGEHDQPGYRHYGEFGVYRRSERWNVQLPSFKQHWLPFLESGSADADARHQALVAIAEDL